MVNLHDINFRVVDRKLIKNGVVELTVDVLKSNFTDTVTQYGKEVNEREITNEWPVVLNAFSLTNYAQTATKEIGFAYTFGDFIFGE